MCLMTCRFESYRERAWEDTKRELGVATWLNYQIVQGRYQDSKWLLLSEQNEMR
nr:MAG TPA: hypothetical protein [Caudoviricetes sp.]